VVPDSPEHRVPSDSLDLRVALDQGVLLEMLEVKAILVNLDSKDPGERQDLMDGQVNILFFFIRTALLNKTVSLSQL